MIDKLNARNLPWLMDAEEVGTAVAHVLTLLEGGVIYELNISATGFPE